MVCSLLKGRGNGVAADLDGHDTSRQAHGADLRDIVVIAQYQRMSHYGMTGFGSASAYAETLWLEDDAKTKEIDPEIYEADKYTSKLGEELAKLAG
jgi:hypothetical protein